MGVRAEFGQYSRVDGSRLDGARSPSHPRPRRLADAATVRPEGEPGFGAGVISVEFEDDKAGSFTFPGVSGPNTLATYQAVPAVAGVVLPFNLFVTNTTLPSGAVGQHYKAQLTASGGDAPYTWSVEKGFGTLPSGLTLNISTGVISGKPSAAGTSTFVVEVTDTKTTTQPRHDNVGWALLSIVTSAT